MLCLKSSCEDEVDKYFLALKLASVLHEREEDQRHVSELSQLIDEIDTVLADLELSQMSLLRHHHRHRQKKVSRLFSF